MHRAHLRIRRAVNQFGDATVDQRPGTHRARLQGDGYAALIQPPTAHHASRLPQGKDLRVSGGIRIDFAAIVCGCEDLVAPVNHRSHGHLAHLGSAAGLLQGKTHHGQVTVRHGGRV